LSEKEYDKLVEIFSGSSIEAEIVKSILNDIVIGSYPRISKLNEKHNEYEY